MAVQLLRAGRPRDDRVGSEVVGVALRLRVRRQEARVLLEREVRLIHDLDALEPLHVVDALEPGHQQPQRIAVIGPHRLAVLPVGDEHVVERLGQRQALGVLAAVGRFGDDPRRAVLDAHLVQQHRQRHPGPLAARHSAVRAGDGGGPRVRPVADAFEEMDARDERQPLQLGHREHERPFHHPLDQQRVLGRVDVGNAVVVLRGEVQRRRGDGPRRLAERRARTGAVRLRPDPGRVVVAAALDLARRGDEARAAAVEDALQRIVVEHRARRLGGRGRRGGQGQARRRGDQAGGGGALLQEPAPARLRLAHRSSPRLRSGALLSAVDDVSHTIPIRDAADNENLARRRPDSLRSRTLPTGAGSGNPPRALTARASRTCRRSTARRRRRRTSSGK